MPFDDFPPAASFLQRGARDGFEVAFFTPEAGGWRIRGQATAVEAGTAWAVEYDLLLDAAGATRRAEVRGRTTSGERRLVLEGDGHGRWQADGVPQPHVDGCLDVDLEASALTNAFPVRRLALCVGEASSAPAAYVRASDLALERLEQRYGRIEDDGARQRFDYEAPAFAFACQIAYDPSGLVLDYPGIASRVT